MRMVCPADPADDSHVMSSIISSENYVEHALKCRLPVMIGALGVYLTGQFSNEQKKAKVTLCTIPDILNSCSKTEKKKEMEKEPLKMNNIGYILYNISFVQRCRFIMNISSCCSSCSLKSVPCSITISKLVTLWTVNSDSGTLPLMMTCSSVPLQDQRDWNHADSVNFFWPASFVINNMCWTLGGWSSCTVLV